MNSKCMELFSYLPKDVLHIVLEFYGKIKYRQGEYINIFSKDDDRYRMLSRMAYPKIVLYTMIEACALREHFECEVMLHNYRLSVWNIYTPPNQIQYFFYNTTNETSKSGIWYRL